MNSVSNCRWLVLVPTEFELVKMRSLRPTALERDGVRVEVCGFGPIAAAARTAQLIAKISPQHVLLIGIAGSYTDKIPLGSATQFNQVGCYGIGVGQGESFEPAHRMGWAQFSSADKEIGDRINLISNNDDHILLTCTAASQNQADVRLRTSMMPNTVAEDMEGFGMAMACELSNLASRFIIRGISNQAGDRNKDNWRVDEALGSACKLANQLIAAYDK